MAIKSMTGFGSASAENDQLVVKVEIKALNGKFLELNMRLPKIYQNKELVLRKMVQNQLERGTVSVYVNIENKKVNTGQYRINKELVEYFYTELHELSQRLGGGNSDIMSKILDLPDVVSVIEEDEQIEQNWKLIADTTLQALNALTEFRLQEGKAMRKTMADSVELIKSLVKQVEQHEASRIADIRERIKNNLDEFVGADKADKSRFEQELVYFIEKLDFAEEKSRLRNHCDFFGETLDMESGGKKLSFITQEMGREINTLGAKAYHFGIQQTVVNMKEELEKVKEMILNVL